MKQLYLFFLLLLTAAGVRAQQVDSIVVVPAAPTTSDPVTVYIYLSFPNGSCADVAYSSMAGTTINAYAFHCMGGFNVICYDVDTLTFPPLSAGSYSLYFTLDAGYGPPGNCSPGIIPYDYDTAYFTVSTISGVDENAGDALRVFPNPASDQLTITNPAGGDVHFQLMSLTGEIVLTGRITASRREIDLSGVAAGSYLYTLVSGDTFISAGKLQVIR